MGDEVAWPADVLSYRRFVGADGKTVYVVERYADSAAALSHLRAFQEIGAVAGMLWLLPSPVLRLRTLEPPEAAAAVDGGASGTGA